MASWHDRLPSFPDDLAAIVVVTTERSEVVGSAADHFQAASAGQD